MVSARPLLVAAYLLIIWPRAATVQPHAIIKDPILLDLEVRLIFLITLRIRDDASADVGVLTLPPRFQETASTATIPYSAHWRSFALHRFVFIFRYRVRAWDMEQERRIWCGPRSGVCLDGRCLILHLNIIPFLRAFRRQRWRRRRIRGTAWE